MDRAKGTPIQEQSIDASLFNADEAAQLFDATARQYMGMSGEEFLHAWDNGYFATPTQRSHAVRVASLIPLIRRTSV
ncbi:MAG TPA: hypothetical protein VFU50_07390 [Terriglobales bacterium]|nr:hypothetical protein [Terriglobales bacterium]